MARASATRWRWPPESWSTRRVAVARELHQLQRPLDAARDLRLARTPRSRSGKATFAADVHVREQRVVLEHHADVALVRRAGG